MYDNEVFEQLVIAGNATGEAVGIERFLVKVKGLDGVPVGALVMFQSGQLGLVRDISQTHVTVLALDSEDIPVGSLAVLKDTALVTPVGEELIGRVVSPLGVPLDGKGELKLSVAREVFGQAPGIADRAILKDQLYSGVTMVDMLFPVVLGQRIAVMGDVKSGKTTFLSQLGVNQIGADRIVIYVLIGKRRVEIDQLVNTLTETGAIAHSIVVVANVFDSLAQSYIAPYVGCAIAEHLWQTVGRDVVIIYDDLSAHAKIYREVSLLARANPGRDSYPGDMFFAHSSLLERAGKLRSNEKTLTALPVVVTPGDDITAYLPTSIMSITDGQIIFDLATFRQNIRPAVNTGLSVSRVGGRAQTASQKTLSLQLMRALAAYREAQEFAHFGSDLSTESRQTLELGRQLFDVLRQPPGELYSIVEQQLSLQAVMTAGGQRQLNVQGIKTLSRETAPAIEAEDQILPTAQQIMEHNAAGGSAS